jgi:hypothetical protein
MEFAACVYTLLSEHGMKFPLSPLLVLKRNEMQQLEKDAVTLSLGSYSHGHLSLVIAYMLAGDTERATLIRMPKCLFGRVARHGRSNTSASSNRKNSLILI